MNQCSNVASHQQLSTNNVATLYSTCLGYVCANIELITRPIKPCQNKHNSLHHQHQHAIEFRQWFVVLNHVICEDLIERLGALNKITDSTLSLFITSSTCLRKLHLKNCTLGKDILRLVLKHHNIDDLSLNNVQIHPSIIQTYHHLANFGK